MKKLLSVILTLTMLLSLTACGGEKEVANNSPVEVPQTSLEILENVWGAYAEEEKFPIIGGNIENYVDGAPGEYSMDYAENMTYNLLIPADQIANVTDVASMTHAMNANNFTCGVFHLAAGVSAADFGAAMKDAVMNNQWMCGFPETLLIKDIAGEYVLVAFGVNDAMTPFAKNLDTAYPSAETLVNEPIG